MAQRTGAERFLASIAKLASARSALALAAAALVLAGCGGGSSDPQEAQTSAGSVAAATSGEAATSPEAEARAKEKAKAEGQAKSGSESPSPSAASAPGATGPQQGGGGAKHGPRIAAPKGPVEQAPTPAEVAQATVANISLQSSAIASGGEGPAQLPAAYTCDGKGSWPELHWHGVPPGTAELAVYAMSVQPVEEQLFVDWAVAGLDPGLEGIEAAQLPKGAVVGTNGFGKKGYEICPADAETYMFAVYALPKALSPKPGFDARDLRGQILDVSGNVGLLPVTYARG